MVFLAPNLACVVVVTGGAHCKNLLRHEGNLALVGILDAIADSFEEDINRLCVPCRLGHSFESCLLRDWLR